MILTALGIFGVYAWASNYWVDLADEGYFLYLASRVYQGDLPYRDFDTYYTPGVFYLYAALFELFGVSIMPVRIAMAAMRVICALLLYGLARRVMPAPFALLPFLLVAAVDPMPIFPEPHPAWTAMVATLLTMEMIARHATSGRLRWIALAGAAAALAFAFKQNVGAFAALAVGGYLLFRPREEVGRLLVLARVAFGVLISLAATVFLWSAMNELIAAAIWLPLLTTLGVLVWRTCWGQETRGWFTGSGAAVRECLIAGAVFVALTLTWLIPLSVALGPREVPWGLFVGAVNQGALILPLEPPPRAAREFALIAIWLPVCVSLVARAVWVALSWNGKVGSRAQQAAPLRWGMVLCVAAGLSLPVPFIPVVTTVWEPTMEDPSFDPWLTLLDANLHTLYLYVPMLGAWGALAILIGRLLSSAQLRHLPSPIVWYLLVGTLAALAMYPRVDTLHAMFAGPPLFLLGAWTLWQTHRGLLGSGNAVASVAVFLALMVVPAAAVAPHAYWRASAILWSDPRAAEPPPYVALALERAPVFAPKHVADNVRGVVEFVRAGTPPGEPFFVYPAAPLFNFLADRPNPTRFDHFFPHALSPDDLTEVIRRLDTSRPRYVLWDHGGVVYWGTESTNRSLSDYIWGCYEQVANFPPYLLLERRC